jgi:uncharacterized membrane protein
VTLTNSSKFAVNISSVTMSGAGANEFIATNNCGTIVPGTAAPAPAVPNCTVSVTFAPTATGIQTATMNINSDAATPFSPVALSGTGTTPTVSLSPTSASFPNQALNVASSPVAITLTNTGTGSLNFQQVGGITITGPAAGDFSQTNNCGQQVAAGTTGNSCIVNIVFTPSALNSRIAALVFYDDALNTPQTVTLSGTGTAGSGVIQLLPTPLAFGNQQVATTVTLYPCPA